MATLDAFGFAKGSRRVQQTNSETLAFIRPDNDIVKKPMLFSTSFSTKQQLKKPTPNTITYYFSQNEQQQSIDLEEEEECCIIRQRIPMLQLWDKIQEEFTQDTYMQMDLPNTHMTKPSHNKKKRQAHTTIVPTLKRQKTDIELSQVMSQFLNVSSKVRYNHSQQDTFMKDYQEDQDEEEHLPRPLRHKMNIQHSRLYAYQITQELLLFD